MLKGQTDKAPTGCEGYVVNGKSLVDSPGYLSRAVWQFRRDHLHHQQDGVLLQKELGKSTTDTATAMSLFDPISIAMLSGV
jgi:hypothetical protein